MKQDILVFGEDWGGHPSSTQHLFKHLGCDHSVLWVNSIGMRRPRLGLRDARRVMRKLSAMTRPRPSPERRDDDPFPVIAPKAVSWPGNPLARIVNRQVLVQQIRRALADHGMEKPVIWTTLPTFADIMDAFPDHRIIYYCGDDFAALDGVDHGPVTACEEKLAGRADVILVASDALAAKFDAARTHVVPHGVDFEKFAKTRASRSSRPVAGFYGSIAPWVDVDLLAATAQRLPEWEFVMVGDIKTDVTALHAFPNVTFKPAMVHHQLPSEVQSWWAALLPFKDCAQIRACNPLKLREYLASGTPVVSTPFPALVPYAEYVNTVESVDQMVAALETSVSQFGAAVTRQDVVSVESWTRRAGDVAAILSEMAA